MSNKENTEFSQLMGEVESLVGKIVMQKNQEVFVATVGKNKTFSMALTILDSDESDFATAVRRIARNYHHKKLSVSLSPVGGQTDSPGHVLVISEWI